MLHRFLPPVARPLLSCALLLAAPIAGARAQAPDTASVRLTGHVVDRRSGEPLAGATIEVAELSLRAVSDESGRFFFTRIPRGRHLAAVRRIGYEPYIATWDVVNDPHVLTIALGSRPLLLQGVTVRGYGVAQQIEERRRSTGYSSVVYSRDNLDRSAAGDVWTYVRPRMMSPRRPRGYESAQRLRTAFYIDELPASPDQLQDLDLDRVYAIEIYGGQHVRVYTLAFIEHTSRSTRNLFPLMLR